MLCDYYRSTRKKNATRKCVHKKGWEPDFKGGGASKFDADKCRVRCKDCFDGSIGTPGMFPRTKNCKDAVGVARSKMNNREFIQLFKSDLQTETGCVGGNGYERYSCTQKSPCHSTWSRHGELRLSVFEAADSLHSYSRAHSISGTNAAMSTHDPSA